MSTLIPQHPFVVAGHFASPASVFVAATSVQYQGTGMPFAGSAAPLTGDVTPRERINPSGTTTWSPPV